jgi:hypothetical protein
MAAGLIRGERALRRNWRDTLQAETMQEARKCICGGSRGQGYTVELPDPAGPQLDALRRAQRHRGRPRPEPARRIGYGGSVITALHA